MKPGAKNNGPKPSKYQDKGLPMAKKGAVKSPASGFDQSVSSGGHNPGTKVGGKYDRM